MQIPSTYASWVKVLEEMKKGSDDVAVLEAMRAGNIEWQSGVAERFAKRLTSVVTERMNRAQDQFDRTIKNGSGESAIVQGMLDLRKTYAFLTEAVNIPAIPEEYRQQYTALVRDQANQIQKSLEDSAKSDPTGRLLSIVKNNRMNAF